MSDKAAIKSERGTKRTCQNPGCGTRFYDLNRDPIACPICNTVYVITLQPPPQVSARPTPRPLKRLAPIPDEVKEQVPAQRKTTVRVTLEANGYRSSLLGHRCCAAEQKSATFVSDVGSMDDQGCGAK